MRKIFLTAVLLIWGNGIAHALPSADLAQFEKANLAYREGKFDEAEALYKALVEKYPNEAAFSYNLGNALHRKGERGTAIAAYERALRRAPRQDDVRFNLGYVRGLLDYKVEDKRFWLIRYAEFFLRQLTTREIQLFASVSGFLFLGSWAFLLFLKPELEWGRVMKFLLILALAGGVLAAVKGAQQTFYREAIVTAEESQVYYGPSVNDQAAFRLGEGIKVYIVDTREGWSRILIASGESGWIQSDQVADIS